MPKPSKALRLDPRRMTVQARAIMHFQRTMESLVALRRSQSVLEDAMVGLVDEYRQTVGPCRLALYVKRDQTKRPQGLYWGGLFRLDLPDGRLRWARRHIRERLSNRIIYLVARRFHDRAIFHAFERRRRELCLRHSRISRRLAALLTALKLVQIPRSFRPTDAPPLEVFGGLDVLLWRVAWARAAAEQAMLDLVASPRMSLLHPYARVTQSGSVWLGWGVSDVYHRGGRIRRGRRHVTARLSTGLLRSLSIPRRDWPRLRAADCQIRYLRHLRTRLALITIRVERG